MPCQKAGSEKKCKFKQLCNYSVISYKKDEGGELADGAKHLTERGQLSSQMQVKYTANYLLLHCKLQSSLTVDEH